VGVLTSLTSQSILLWRLVHGSRLDVHELRAHHQLTGESPLDNNFSGIIITVTLYTTEPAAMWLLVQYLYPCDAVPACYGLYSGALVNMWNVLRKVLTQTLFYGESLPFVGTMLLEPSWLVCWFGGLIGHSILAPRATIGHWTSDGNRVGKMLGEDALSVNHVIGTVLVGLLVWWFDWTLYIST
jgi:hypothetical protein